VGELGRRILVALVAIPAAGYLVYLGGWPFALLLSLVAGLAAWEFFRIADAGGVHAFRKAGIPLAALIPLLLHTNRVGLTQVPLAAGALVLLIIFASAVFRRVGDRPLAAVAATVFGVLYTGGMLSFGYLLRYHRFVIGDLAALALVGLPLVLTWASDTGGYAFGRMFGKRKLYPAVSAGKTWAGSIGGVLLTVAACWAYVQFVLRPTAQLGFTPTGLVLFGVLMSVTAQIGDLAESLLKREAGVKDSSHLIPGHGGVLDRFDSLLFVLPVAAVLLTELLIPAPR
jgi:phosphatidate cytidylyltransferase